MSDQNLSSTEITAMLRAWSKGLNDDADRLFLVVYNELRKQASSFLRRERQGHTLQTTALINETYLKLREQRGFEWKSRDHFFAICATLMRRILIDYAKKRHRAKRGGYAEHLPIDSLEFALKQKSSVDLIILDGALERLFKLDQQQVRVVELRFFGGLTVEATAEVLGVSASTVKRDWRMAKAWLRHELDGGDARGEF